MRQLPRKCKCFLLFLHADIKIESNLYFRKKQVFISGTRNHSVTTLSKHDIKNL